MRNIHRVDHTSHFILILSLSHLTFSYLYVFHPSALYLPFPYFRFQVGLLAFPGRNSNKRRLQVGSYGRLISENFECEGSDFKLI